MSADLYTAWLAAGDWVAANWPNLAIAAGLAAFAWWSIRRGLRDRHHLPPAPDNLAPVDDELLIRCRRIARQPLVNPELVRPAYRYHRQKGDETP